MKKTNVLYEELRPDEFIRRMNAFPVAYLPLGTLEWHGLHLPLGSDGLQSKAIFEKMASNIGGIVLPMLFLGPDRVQSKDDVAYYGMDHISFAEGLPQQLEGTAHYIEDEQFNALLDRIMHNLYRAGFKVVIGHGHGPSNNAFAARKQTFKEDYGVITYTLWELGYTGDEGIQTDHAAANETSLMMAVRSELVDMAALDADSVPVGVWGEDPRKAASAARGHKLIEKNIKAASQKLQAIVAELSYEKRKLNYHHVKDLLRDESSR